MSIHLGRLNKVELRDFFENEARDFTPWLAEEENLELLSNTLGLDIELEDTEVKIGKFSADNDSSTYKILDGGKFRIFEIEKFHVMKKMLKKIDF